MDVLETASRISTSDATRRGLSALVREVEEGRDQIILSDNKPVAVIVGVERFERLQGLLKDLVDLTLVASRMATTGGSRHTLDDVLERFGYTREAFSDEPDQRRSAQDPDPPARTRGPFQPVDRANHPLMGKWRIVEMDMFDRDYLDMEEPACITFNARGTGELVFGLVHGWLECGYSPYSIEFTWVGNDEMDDASGAGSAEIEDDGTVTGDIRFHTGDETDFKARRW